MDLLPGDKYWKYSNGIRTKISKKQQELTQNNTLDVSYDTTPPDAKGVATITYTINKKRNNPESYNLTVNNHLYKQKSLFICPQIITSNLGDLIFACDQNGGINCDKSTVKALNSKDGSTVDIPITIEKAATGERVARLTLKLNRDIII